MSLQKGENPLMMATKKEIVDIVMLLLDHGADINSTDQVTHIS